MSPQRNPRRTSVLPMAGFRERISLRGLLTALAAIGLILVIVAAAVTYFNVTQVKRETNLVINTLEPADDASQALRLSVRNMEAGLFAYIQSGNENRLSPYRYGEANSDIALQQLTELLGDDAEFQVLISEATESRDAWIADIAEPSLAEAAAGDLGAAAAIADSQLSDRRFDRLIADVDQLDAKIDSDLEAALDRLNDLTTRMAVLQGFGMLILLVAVALAWLLLMRWVLSPLNDLRRQMRVVARDRELLEHIDPTGPREIQAVGRDAEQMRQQLVHEIENVTRADETARRATESLASRAPVVASLMRELATPTNQNPVAASVHGEIHAAETVLAGDFWDVVETPADGVALVIADVAGHGDEVGVAATRMKHMIAVALGSGSGPGAALELAARRLANEDEPPATAAIAVIDPRAQTVTWANAGHPPPMLLRPDGGDIELQRTGPLLSWIGGPWAERTARFEPGDRLLMYSDGLIESHDQAGKQLGAEGLRDLVQAADTTADDEESLVRGVLTRGRDRAVDWDRDDVTLIAASLPEPPA